MWPSEQSLYIGELIDWDLKQQSDGRLTVICSDQVTGSLGIGVLKLYTVVVGDVQLWVNSHFIRCFVFMLHVVHYGNKTHTTHVQQSLLLPQNLVQQIP